MNSTKPTIPELLKEWEGMTFSEKEYAIRRDVLGYAWWRSRTEEGYWVLRPHRPTFGDWEYEEDGPEWLNLRDEGSEKLDLSVGTVIQNGGFYTSEDSPASLVAGLEEKVIERIGEHAWIEALGHVTGACVHSAMSRALATVARATRDQRCCACWIAKRMAAQGGEG